MNPAPDRRHDRIVRMAEVRQRTGLHPATIYRRIAAGLFPRQIPLGANSSGWHESDIDAWVADPMGWGRQAA